MDENLMMMLKERDGGFYSKYREVTHTGDVKPK